MAQEKAFAERAREAAPAPVVEKPPAPDSPEPEHPNLARATAMADAAQGATSEAGPAFPLDGGGLPGRARVMRTLQRALGSVRVSRMMTPGASAAAEKDREDSEPSVMKRSAGQAGGAGLPDQLPSSVAKVLKAGGGEPISPATRAPMEQALGADLRGVRVHTDTAAARAAHDINADAFTAGQDIFFGAGRYRPETGEGRKLLAHETTHTIQQLGRDEAAQSDRPISHPDDPAEREATHVARQVADGQRLAPRALSAAPPQVQREGASPAPAPTDLPDLSQLEWKPEDDYVLYLLSQDRLFVLPSPNLLYRPQTGRAPSTAPQPEPWLGVPVVGKEGRRLVRTSTGIGIWLDAGGRPAALLPLSLALLRARTGVSQIDKIYPLHVHDDHVRDLIPEIRRSGVRAANLILPEAWLRGSSGPLAKAVNTLRTTTDPDLVRLGYGAGWDPVSPSMRSLPTTGIIALDYQEGNVRLRLLGTGEAFENYARTHAQGRVRAEIGDTASFLALVQHPSASFDISVIGDLRGADILRLRDAMERVQAGSFQRAFSKVRVLDGLQHHLGVVRDNRDVDGVKALIEATLLKTGELTIIVQTGEDFRNEALMRALYRSGVRVITLLEPKAGERPGSAIVSTEGTASARGAGAEDVAGQRSAARANTRLGALRAALETVCTNGDLLEYKAGDRASTTRDLETQVSRLENLLRELNEVNFNALRPQSSQQRNLRALQDILTELNKVQGIEALLTADDYTVLQRTSENASDLRNLSREIDRLRRTGESGPALYELISRLSPETARALMFDERGKPLPPQQVRRNLNRQVELEQSGYARGGLAPWGAGGKAVSLLLIAVEVGSQIATAVSQAKEANLSRNILRFLRMVEWWLQRGLEPELGAATDPFFSRAHVDIGSDATQQQAIWDRVQRKVWEHAPDDRRKKESELPQGVQKAGDLDYLWIQAIPDDRWDGFNLWVDTHIRTYDEYAASFKDTNTEAVRHQGDDFESAEWEIHVAEFVTAGWNTLRDKWVKSDRLTTIMRATAKRVMRETEAGIERAWGRREQKQPQGPAIGPASTGAGQGPVLPIESLNPTRKARFKAKTGRKLFSEFDPVREILSGDAWWDDDVLFLVFDNYSAPAGYVLVSGGNYDTYAAIRAHSTYQYDPRNSVRIPKPSRDLGDVLSRGGFTSKFPPDEDLSPSERAALDDLRSQRNGAKFRSYESGASDPYMGEVQYWFVGPNTRAVGLVHAGDLEEE
jgi:hypothetical protein